MDLQQSSIHNITFNKLPWQSGRDSLNSLNDISLIKDNTLQSGIPKIYTVAQTLKDPYILSHIKPDYGSLGQFMGDVGLSKDLLMQKKKKMENHQENQQKRIRNLIKNKKPQQILKQNNNTAMQKKIASKVMIQNLFQSKFGMTIQTFYSQNNKQDNHKKTSINIANLQEMLNSLTDPQSHKSTQKIYQHLIMEKDNQKNRKMSLNVSFANKLDQSQKINLLNKIKNQYFSLRRFEFSDKNQEYEKIMKNNQEQEKQENKIPLSITHARQGVYANQNKKRQTFFIQNNETDLILQSFNKLKTSTYLHILYTSNIDSLKQIKLCRLRISQDVLNFYIQAFTKLAYHLQELIISSIAIQDTKKFCEGIAFLLQNSKNLKKLSLNYLDLGTKQFCLVCLGLGKSKSIQEISFKNNNIDNDCQNALQMILKFCSQLQIMNLSNNAFTSTLKGVQKDDRVILRDTA